MIHTFEEALEKIFQFEQVRDYSLENMCLAMQLLNDPLKDVKVIHIAGTNGKGSVSQMMFSILKQAGKSVGVYSQPHIHDIRERARTDIGIISKKEFISITNVILDLGIELSYFEKTTLIAFEHFKRVGVEYAVIEVGVGGLLDSTNVVNPYITCITTISLDHQGLLGNTLEEISVQKAGIIKSDIPIVYNIDNAVIHDVASQLRAPKIYTNKWVQTNLYGTHQEGNAGLAFEIASYIGISDENIDKGLQQVRHSGRLQFLSQNILIDGAHNQESLMSLLNFIDLQKESYKNICYCISLKQGKDSSLLVNTLGKAEDYIVIESYHNALTRPHDLIQSLDTHDVKSEVLKVSDIYTQAYQNKDTLYVICGSLYILPDFLLQNDSIYLALGSNIGEGDKNLDRAKKLLGNNGIEIIQESKRYTTKPMYYKDQGDFTNSVIKVKTSLNPYELLQVCQKTETSMGRVKEIEKGPRCIDIDILFYEDRYIVEPDLMIPHIGIPERDFVLKPLLDVAGDIMYQGKKISGHLNPL